jgi:hypothetical protein
MLYLGTWRADVSPGWFLFTGGASVHPYWHRPSGPGCDARNARRPRAARAALRGMFGGPSIRMCLAADSLFVNATNCCWIGSALTLLLPTGAPLRVVGNALCSGSVTNRSVRGGNLHTGNHEVELIAARDGRKVATIEVKPTNTAYRRADGTITIPLALLRL